METVFKTDAMNAGAIRVLKMTPPPSVTAVAGGSVMKKITYLENEQHPIGMRIGTTASTWMHPHFTCLYGTCLALSNKC